MIVFLLSLIPTFSQPNVVNKQVKARDTISLNLMLSNNVDSQAQLQAILSSSTKSTDALASSINRFTDVVAQGILLNQQTRIDIIAKEMNTTPDVLKKSFKRNSNIKLVAIICLLIVVAGSLSRIFLKGLDWHKAIGGLALVVSIACVGSYALYHVLSLIFNNDYYLIKDFSSALF